MSEVPAANRAPRPLAVSRQEDEADAKCPVLARLGLSVTWPRHDPAGPAKRGSGQEGDPS